MTVTHTIEKNWKGAGREIKTSKNYTSDASQTISGVSVPDSSADFFVEIAIDVSEIKSIFILSDVDMTLETNDGATPIDTINLKAGIPYIWHTDSYFTNILDTDVTGLYLTTGSVGVGTFELEVVTDPTP